MVEETQEKKEKFTFKQYLQSFIWTVKIVYKMSPIAVSLDLLFGVISELRPTFSTYIIAKVIDTAVQIASSGAQSIREVYPLLFIVILFQTILGISRAVGSYFSEKVSYTFNREIDVVFYNKLYTLGVQSLEDPETNNQIFRSWNNLQNIHNQYSNIVYQFSTIISLLVSAIIISKNIPIMIPLIAIFSIPRILADKKVRGELWKFDIRSTEKRRIAKQTAATLSSSHSLHEIIINDSFAFLDKKVRSFNEFYLENILNMTKKFYALRQVFHIVATLPIYYGFVIILNNLITKSISVGSVYFQLQILQNFQGNLEDLFSRFNSTLERTIRIMEIKRIFDRQPSFPNGQIVLPTLIKGPEIEIKNLNFRYPNQKNDVLKNINFTISPGEKIAIVGHNGAGKTTIVKLLSRMYLPTSGKISVAGVDLVNANSESLHKNMAVLFQDFYIYSYLNVEENTLMGKSTEKVDQAKVIESTQNAEALNFIEKFPNKFNQILTETVKGGTKPSTGQWQKIALARFFYRNAPLLIFDEPTASIDAESEHNIFNKIYDFFKDKTVIIISHRFSTVRNADRIIVLKDGEVTESGNHAELMKLNGVYATSFKLQAEGYKTEDIDTIV